MSVPVGTIFDVERSGTFFPTLCAGHTDKSNRCDKVRNALLRVWRYVRESDSRYE